MVSARARSLALLALFAALVAALAAPAPAAPRAPHALARARRQLPDDDALQPLEGAEGEEQTREKRKLEGVTQAKFGIKNAVLGFVFSKINSLIDAKTRLVESLDKQNIALNKQYGIEPPQNGLASLSGIVGQVIGPKLQMLGPKIQLVSGLLGGASGGSSGGGGGGDGGAQEWHYVEGPGAPLPALPALPGEPLELYGYAAQFRGGRGEGPGEPAGATDLLRRHPRVRPQQGEPGPAGQPVWAIRVAAHPDY